MGLARRIVASYLPSLRPEGYGLDAGATGVINYLLDSWFAKVDERNRAAMRDEKPYPVDLSSHIRELWLSTPERPCEIHECVNLNQSFPGYAKALHAWAFTRLFPQFGGSGPYDMVPFLDSYPYKEALKSSVEFRIQSEQMNVSPDMVATLPVFGTFFVRHRVSGVQLVVSVDLCYRSVDCAFTVSANPVHKAEAEAFFDDLRASMRVNDIYSKQCLGFHKGVLDFMSVSPTSWSEIILKADVKEVIRDNSTRFLARMDDVAALGMVPNRNVILISPPGMAKTTMFRATSNEMDGVATRIWCTGKSIRYPEHVTSLFEAARSLSPCIVFIEDMDLFGGERSVSRDSSVLNEFLAQLDGAQANAGIVVMASTNDIDSMDEALINRPGRFSTKVEIPLPDDEDRAAMLHSFMSGMHVRPGENLTSETIKNVVDLTAGFTGDYLKEVVKSAVIRCVSEGRGQGGTALVSGDDLIKATKQVLDNFRIGKRAKKHHQMTADLDVQMEGLSLAAELQTKGI